MEWIFTVDWFKPLATLVVTIFAGYLLRWTRTKANLQFNTLHQFAFDLPMQGDDPILMVFTRSILIENVGRATATNIEVVHHRRPQNLKIFPPVDWSDTEGQENHHFLRIPRLPGKSAVTIEILTTGLEPPNLMSINSDQGAAKFSARQFNRVFPGWFNYGFLGLACIGFVVSVYWLLTLGIALWMV